LLREILDAIEMVDRFTADMDFQAFREDPKTVAAVERKLRFVSEAAIRLGAKPRTAFRASRGARSGASATGCAINICHC
jgi:uncharacterized protein with HEPN domain